MRAPIDRLINFFDSNPWKSAAVLVFIVNVLLLADAEVVLIISLSLIFFYLILATVNSFETFGEQKFNNEIDSYTADLNEIIKNLESVEGELDKSSDLVLVLSELLSTWRANSLLYRCVEIKKTKNYFTPFIVLTLEALQQQYIGGEVLDLTSQEEKTKYILSTLV